MSLSEAHQHANLSIHVMHISRNATFRYIFLKNQKEKQPLCRLRAQIIVPSMNLWEKGKKGFYFTLFIDEPLMSGEDRL